MHINGLIMTLVLSVGLSACQGRSVVDREAPFGSKVVRLGDVEVAAVDGTAIYLSDVEQLARAKGDLTLAQNLDPKSSLFKSTLRELIDQRVLGLAAITQSLDQTETAKRRQATALEQLYGRFVIEKALLEKVTDEAVMRLYEEQKALNDRGPERRARVIVVATQEEAGEALQRLEDGEEFGVLAGILSIEEATRNKNGDLGYFSRDMLDGKIAKVAFETPLKTLAPVFETERGFHLLEVVAQRNVPQRPFEEMEPELREFLTYETINNMIRDLRAESDIRLNVAAPIDKSPASGVQDEAHANEDPNLIVTPDDPTGDDVKTDQ